MITDPFFETVYNDPILDHLAHRFGPFARQHADIPASSEIMGRMLEKLAKKGRRGEVVMVVPNEWGQFWVHTKDFYPEGVYRLMTGGLEPGEKPEPALHREVEEETGFKTEIDRCLAVITYSIANERLACPFVSYVMLTRPAAGQPRPTDPKEAITDFRAVTTAGLANIAGRLRGLSGKFADWGLFRALAHEAALAQLLAGR